MTTLQNEDRGKADENRNSGLFGFIRRNSVGEKDKFKSKQKFSSQRVKPFEKRPPLKDAERKFELCCP